MAEQVFKSPGFFEREIEKKSIPVRSLTEATPVAIIGASEKGPAFIPTVVRSQNEFETIFGKIQKNKLAGHAVAEYFSRKGNSSSAAIQFVRLLGIGNSSQQKAGFEFKSTTESGIKWGGTQFLTAEHKIDAKEYYSIGAFSNNATIAEVTDVGLTRLVRAMFLLHKDYRLSLIDNNVATDDPQLADDVGQFTVRVIKKDSNITKDISVSLDPSSSSYISKSLNTDPLMIDTYGYVLYLDFPIDSSILSIDSECHVAILREDKASADETFGNFKSGFLSPKTTKFISQPFGLKEYDLFHFESLDDGAYASSKYKISITNLRASTDVDYKYGSFNVEIRDLNDTDESPIIIEQFTNVTLDPTSKDYIAKVIGDQKHIYNFKNVSSEDEKRIFIEGDFENNSRIVRVVMSDDVANSNIPPETLPFGFKAIPVIKTLNDATSLLTNPEDADANTFFDKVVLPPIPMRFKITNGDLLQPTADGAYLGKKNDNESLSPNLYWGLMNSNFSTIENPNSLTTTGDRFNSIMLSYTKFMGLLGTFTEDTVENDDFNLNKFSLSKVAFSKQSVAAIDSSIISNTLNEAIYVRSAKIGTNQDAIDYKIDLNSLATKGNTDVSNGATRYRVTFASLLSEDKVKFNKYSNYTKFTSPLFGGFDGINIFDFDTVNMNDWSTSTDTTSSIKGKASLNGYQSALATYDSSGTGNTIQGAGLSNNIVFAYKTGVDLVMDDASGIANVLLLPGIKEPLLTEYASNKAREYGRALYLMDIPSFANDGQRLYRTAIDNSKKPDVDLTISQFLARNLDNNYTAAYFPDVVMKDASDPLYANLSVNPRLIQLPSSIAALSALAASEGNNTPWFAPAGFTKGALPNVSSVVTRLKSLDRDNLYEARINPIAIFPGNEIVIFGQKTLQLSNTALSRVNVRRLMIAIKRNVEISAQRLLFKQNTAENRKAFEAEISSFLSGVKINQGIENFRVVINNDPLEADNNILSGKIIVVPTRVIEFIAMDFVVTNSGVQFN
jgi:hypothetical protein